MRVEVSDSMFVYDLLSSLKCANYEAALASETTVDVRVPDLVTAEQARLHLGLYLANWRARHPGIVADIVESA
jgi:hypothetical protein